MFTKEELIEIRNLIDSSKDKLTDETNRIRNSIASKIFSKLHGCPQEEPVSEELEEEISRLTNQILNGDKETYSKSFIASQIDYIARHFADWQKQQMMKAAEEVAVTSMPNDWAEYMPRVIVPVSTTYDLGEKVKVIIIKED